MHPDVRPDEELGPDVEYGPRVPRPAPEEEPTVGADVEFGSDLRPAPAEVVVTGDGLGAPDTTVGQVDEQGQTEDR